MGSLKVIGRAWQDCENACRHVMIGPDFKVKPLARQVDVKVGKLGCLG